MYTREPSKHEWLKFALGACIFFGFGNFLMSLLGSKYGWQGMLPQSIGQIISWLVYHNQNKSQKGESFYWFNSSRIIGVLLRSTNHIVCIWMNISAFEYAYKAHVN
jgi:hypothetical protein